MSTGLLVCRSAIFIDSKRVGEGATHGRRDKDMRVETTDTTRRVRYGTDVGGVYIGNSTFTFIVPNGYGDGWHEYVIYEDAEEFTARRDAEDKGKPYPLCWNFFTSFENEETAFVTEGEELEPGRWGCWYRDGVIAIVCWEKF